MELTGEVKVAVVVGATRGIGLAIAKDLSCRGWLVISMARGAADTLSNSVPLTPGARFSLQVDVTDANSVKHSLAVVERVCGRLDLLVCSVGMAKLGGIETTSPIDFERIVKVNLIGPFFLFHYSSKLLKESRGKVIVLGSRAARGNFTNVLAYGASKAGLLHLTQTAAREWSEAGITLHVISPSAVSTPMRASVFPEENPKSHLSPEQIAALCSSLLEEQFRITTGSVIDVPF
ncbi:MULTISPECIES: SDR family NAD(P)-dependent oxidoreductase [Rhizobium/Agrobacterium group]|uniref:2,3-dihydro-2,3-dihydroxybenzoate dehydrogenase protein n=2 Tax=Rhizobium/Agrobacterium group TaxID=227290 RepID=B9JQP6_RHIR8|nr:MULTISPECIES: SDR family oxidoreductase [Agrobacterium tumefaciens complex]ACM31488.1 2,3-dihydro-2,3-dihydroxybenzoate dehydrogenase protein [Rhizobium rhizogenes K84]AAS02152.1 probable 2,3-dihydro-2,3-dihydroxybenzoate dehydrogenase protein [Agrobacterium radiobacter]QCL82904.1 SDR family oxidoreductase [Agrobacterium tumefaciens]UXS56420.1 SDR family oxidoreductase [Agrobacterium tumefaciens]UXS66764.1 SDR family oxidoreductase [Agrobacterium tumefaciens]